MHQLCFVISLHGTVTQLDSETDRQCEEVEIFVKASKYVYPDVWICMQVFVYGLRPLDKWRFRKFSGMLQYWELLFFCSFVLLFLKNYCSLIATWLSVKSCMGRLKSLCSVTCLTCCMAMYDASQKIQVSKHFYRKLHYLALSWYAKKLGPLWNRMWTTPSDRLWL